MKVFGICASPRNNTTEYVLKIALDKLNLHNFETEIYDYRKINEFDGAKKGRKKEKEKNYEYKNNNEKTQKGRRKKNTPKKKDKAQRDKKRNFS